MDIPTLVHLVAPADEQSTRLIDSLARDHQLTTVPLTERHCSLIAPDALGLLDLRILEQPYNLPAPLQYLLTQGRWLLINAQKPFLDDFILFNPGVCGLLHAGETAASLMPALNSVARGELWMPRAFLAQVFERQRMRDHKTPIAMPELTRREWQVIRGLLCAENNREISQRLSVEESTVKRHLYNLFRKIGVRNRLEALKWAHTSGLDTGREFRPTVNSLKAG